MIVLSPSIAMMIKKKAKDTTRKNVARSSAIMMTHLLCWPGCFLLPTSHLGELDPQWAESVPITMPEERDEDSPQHAEHDRDIIPAPDHYAVAGWL